MPDWVEQVYQDMRRQKQVEVADAAQKGGPGSGHWGHAGRPGKRGGSVPGKRGGRWSKHFADTREELIADEWNGEYWKTYFRTEDILGAPIVDSGNLDFQNDDIGLVTRYAAEEWGAWADSLPYWKKRALYDYTTEYYQEVNSYLRTGEITRKPGFEHDEEFFPEQDISDMISDIDAIMTATTNSSIILHRGGGGARLAQMPIGTEFTDKAFVSASMDKSLAMRYTDRSRSNVKTLLRIHVPQGQRMAYTGYYESRTGTMTSAGSHGGEWEILLPRGTSFRVINKKLEGDLNIVDLEVVQ